MDDRAQSQIDAVLAHANPETLGKLSTEELATQLADLYTELDYLHPFSDGNSRTLRTFTRQLARQAGYELAWDRFNHGTTGRDALYIARDHGVNRLAKRYVQHEQTLRRIIHSLNRIKGNPSLQELVRGIISPSRAVAFEQLTEAEAIQEHPELKYAYDTLHAARHYFSKQLANESDVQSALDTVMRHIQQRLNIGEVQGFSRRGPGHAERGEKE